MSFLPRGRQGGGTSASSSPIVDSKHQRQLEERPRLPTTSTCSRKRFSLVLFVVILRLVLYYCYYYGDGTVLLAEEHSLGGDTVSTDSPTLPLLLQVPFYVYENTTLNWYHAAASQQWSNEEEGKGGFDTYKHADDWWLLQAALRHPRRTHHAHEAKLFFVPTLLNAVASLKAKRPKLCVADGQVCFREHKGGQYQYVNQVLGEQPWFQRHGGRDHVLVASHFAVGKYYGQKADHKTAKHPDLFGNLRDCNVISRQGLKPIPHAGRYSLPSCYIGTPCPSDSDNNIIPRKTYDLALIASLHPEKPDFQSRRDICKWLSSSQSFRNEISVSVCGSGSQCPALSQSKYGFHVRGDSWGSNRVMDTFLSRTVPLFTNEAQYDVLPSFVPWRNLTYLVNVDSEASFWKSLEDVLSRPASEYHDKLRLMERYMPIFDHTTIYRFDAYMAEFARLQGFQ